MGQGKTEVGKARSGEENTEIYPAAYDRQKGKWRFCHDPGMDATSRSLTLATFNTWFGDYHFEKRFRAILELLRKTNAHIIALQEVKAESLKILLEEDWVKAGYFVSDIACSTFYGYGVVLLSSIPIKALNLHPLKSTMGRHVLIAEFNLNGEKLLVATTHLESLRHSAEKRAVQLRNIFALLNESENSVLMGDFNFCSSWEENANLDPNYSDVWSTLRPDEPGYTEDTEINTMRKHLAREEKQVRFDRIILRSAAGCWQPEKINRIGLKPISSDQPDLFPSDHFGLVATLKWRKMIPL